MIELLNIYNDDQSAIIIDETSANVINVEDYPSLGNSPFNNFDSIQRQAQNNLQFLELNIFNGSESFILSINSAKPLLKLPSTGKYYFGDYHYHAPSKSYMVGKKHTAIPHEQLEVVRQNQILPYPLQDKFIKIDAQNKYVGNATTKFAIKTSEIFDVLKNLDGFTLNKNSKFFISYGIFQDVFLRIREKFTSPGTTT